MWKTRDIQEELYYRSNDLGTTFNTNCTSFTIEELKFFNRLRNVTAILCTLITVIILLYLIYRKAYTSLFQRLYLYLVIGTLFCETALALTLEHQWQYPGQETVCTWVGFFTQWSYVLVYILSYEIIVYLLYLVMSKIQGATLLPQWIRESRCCGFIVESVYIALPVIISTVFAILPYLKRSYGVSGPWCWVVSLNDECEPTGFVTQVVFLGMYMAVGIVGMTVSIVFMVVYFRLANRYTEAQLLLKQTLFVMIFQFFHILTAIYSLTVRLHTLLTRQYHIYGLWFIHALNIPIGTLIFPLGYLLCFYSIRKTILMTCKRIAKTCFKENKSASIKEQNNVIVSKYPATAPVSDRITQPSHTYFVVEHPDVPSEISTITFNAGDTGYGSTNITG